MPDRTSLIALLLLLAALLPQVAVGVEDPAADDGSKPAISEEQLLEWIADLNSPEYRRRKIAASRLMQGDRSAVPVLEKALESADLETTGSILKVLSKLSLSFEPMAGGVDQAWDTLERISTSGSSSASVRARFALGEVRDARRSQADDELSGAGIFVGVGEVHLGSSITTAVPHVKIPANWKGDEEVLFWLQWLQGYETLVLCGDRVTPSMVESAVTLPDLRNLVIRDTSVSTAHLEPVRKVAHLNHFQMVNVKAGDELIDTIKLLPIRRILTLFGTDITLQGRNRLTQQFPGLEIHCRGGFLGVQCSAIAANCEVTVVTPESGAADGGVLPGDVITKFGIYPVVRFADLQAAIGQHTAAEKDIPLVVQRRGAPVTLKVQLKRQFP